MTPEAFSALLGAIIGFLLFALWDSWKERERGKREKDRILSLLGVETAENLMRVNTIQDLLKHEIAISGLGEMLVTTPPRLAMDGWDMAKAGDLLGYIGEKDLQKWILLYGNVAMMNSNLEGRELFKTTSTALGDYKERMIEFDKTILDGTGPVLQRAKDAIESLPTHVRLKLKDTIPTIEIAVPAH